MRNAAITSTNDGFSVCGCATFSNVVSLRHEGEKLLAQYFLKNKSATVNFSDFKDHNPCSFSLLLCWMRLAKKMNGDIRFVNLPLAMERSGEVVWIGCE
jgi:hypothetical protein